MKCYIQLNVTIVKHVQMAQSLLTLQNLSNKNGNRWWTTILPNLNKICSVSVEMCPSSSLTDIQTNIGISFCWMDQFCITKMSWQSISLEYAWFHSNMLCGIDSNLIPCMEKFLSTLYYYCKMVEDCKASYLVYIVLWN